jgi:dUTP pyrophosphatase
MDHMWQTTKTTKTEYVIPRNKEIRYKRTLVNATTPHYQTAGAAGFDMTIAEGVVIQPGSLMLITTGLVIATPKDHYLRITGRSSTPRKWGVQIIEGVIDEDYCGDDDVIKLQVWNFTDRPQTLPMGARIAQGIFIPITRGTFVPTDKMGQSRGGFGSTG